MPIAQTFSKGHRMKILISSSNHPRYQSCPNLPIEDGDFFRRFPNDGRGYVYKGKLMYPRVAVQRIAFSPEHPSHIDLPLYLKEIPLASEENNSKNITGLDALVFPNPTQNTLNIYLNNSNLNSEVMLYNNLGQLTYSGLFKDHITLNVSGFDKGIYILKLKSGKEIITRKVAIN